MDQALPVRMGQTSGAGNLRAVHFASLSLAGRLIPPARFDTTRNPFDDASVTRKGIFKVD
jgi:hypothetical protein